MKTYIAVERVDGDVERGVVPLHLLRLLLLSAECRRVTTSTQTDPGKCDDGGN